MTGDGAEAHRDMVERGEDSPAEPLRRHMTRRGGTVCGNGVVGIWVHRWKEVTCPECLSMGRP